MIGEAAGEYPAMRFLSLVSPPSPATAGRQIFFKICIDSIIFMDVNQAVISRWESGKVSPNAWNLDKLKEILS